MRRTTQRGSSRSISALGRCQEDTCQIDCPGKPPLIFGSTPKTPLIGIHGEEKRFAEPGKRTSPSTYRWAMPRFTGTHIERIFSLLVSAW